MTTQMSSRSINQFDRRIGGVYCFRHRSALSIGDSDFGRKRKEKRTCFVLVMGYRFLKGFLMVVLDLYIYGFVKIRKKVLKSALLRVFSSFPPRCIKSENVIKNTLLYNTVLSFFIYRENLHKRTFFRTQVKKDYPFSM